MRALCPVIVLWFRQRYQIKATPLHAQAMVLTTSHTGIAGKMYATAVCTVKVRLDLIDPRFANIPSVYKTFAIHAAWRLLLERQGEQATGMVLHGAYYLKDRETRPQVWYCMAPTT